IRDLLDHGRADRSKPVMENLDRSFACWHPAIIPSINVTIRAVLPAILDGLRRAASAPAVLLGTLALTFAFSLGPGLYPDSVIGMQYTSIAPLLPFGIALYGPYNVTWLIVWSFLGGGILDRYARGRPTRARGFFAACGAHFPAMLRLGIVELLLFLGIRAVL